MLEMGLKLSGEAGSSDGFFRMGEDLSGFQGVRDGTLQERGVNYSGPARNNGLGDDRKAAGRKRVVEMVIRV